MQEGTISGNTASGNYGFGGGVYIQDGTLTKTGGTIRGNDMLFGDRNTTSKQDHAIYLNSGYSDPSHWRNATAEPDDKTGGYGFWLND